MSERASNLVRVGGRTVVRGAAMATANVRPQPDIVIVGVKRGATTSLFRDLERHRSMCPLVPSARRLPLRENMKGVHYFDSDMARSMRWYRSHFATSTTLRRRRAATGASFTAEASPYYFFHPLAAERAADALTETTFVVLLRDPVERTVSHWSEQTRNGVETLSLADALAAEDERVGDDGARLADGSVGVSAAHEQQTYAAQSEYADSLERWITAVGRERLVVLFSENYAADPVGTVATITEAIGLASPNGRGGGEHRNAAPRDASLDPQVDAMLTERFRPDVARLTEQLGTTPPWPRFAPAP